MSIMSFKKLLLLTCFIFLTDSVWAQVKAISLKECLDIALQNNPDIRLALEGQNKSMADYQFTRAADRLQVLAAIRMSEDTSVEKKGNVGIYQIFTGLIATYPLVNPGQGSKEESARKKLDIAKINEKKARDAVLLSVKMAYYSSIGARKNTELRERLKKSYEKRLLTVKGLVQTGDRPILEQSMAEVSLSQANLEYKKYQNIEQIAKSELKASMGLVSDNSEILTEDFSDMYQIKYSIDEIRNFINQYCPDVIISRFETEIARENIWYVRAQHLPSVDIDALMGFRHLNIDPKNIQYRDLANNKKWKSYYGIGLSAKMSVYNGGSIAAMTDGAVADFNRALYNERKVFLQAVKNAQNAINKLNEIREQIEISKLNIENARINLNLAQRSYESGIGSQLIVQNAEMSYLQAEIGLINAKQEYFSTIAQLANLIGLEERDLCGIK
jgi:outer membrane protein